MVTYQEKEYRIGSEYTFYRNNRIIGSYDSRHDEIVFYTQLTSSELYQVLKIIGGC